MGMITAFKLLAALEGFFLEKKTKMGHILFSSSHVRETKLQASKIS